MWMDHAGLARPSDDHDGGCFVRLDQFHGDRFSGGDWLDAGSVMWVMGDLVSLHEWAGSPAPAVLRSLTGALMFSGVVLS